MEGPNITQLLFYGVDFIRQKFKDDVSTAQLAVFLAVCMNEGIYMKDIENKLKISQVNVSRNTSKLEAQNLVVKQPDLEDSRRNMLYLTIKGKKLRLDLENYMRKV